MNQSVSIEHYLNVRSATTPTFSPDGRMLAYLTNTSGVAQIWCLDLTNLKAPPQQMTFHQEAVSLVKFAPNRNDLIYAMDSGGNECHQLYLLAEGSEKEHTLTAEPKVMHNWGCWSADGSSIAYTANANHPALMDVFVMDVESGKVRKILAGDGWHTVEKFSPDMRELLILDIHGVDTRELNLIEIATGQKTQVTDHPERSLYKSSCWAGDGSGFYTITNQGRDFLGVAFFACEGGEPHWIHIPENDVEEIALSPSGEMLAIINNIKGYSRLEVHDLVNGRIVEAPELLSGVISGLAWSPDGGQLAFSIDGATCNPDIWLWDLAVSQIRQLTHSDRAGFASDDWVEPELIEYSTFDKRLISAFLYRPKTPVPAEGHPAIIVVHGGPADQFRPIFTPPLQFYLAQGYAVLAPNVRGSTGYGAAFAALDDVYLRMDSVTDLLHARNWLGAQADIDENRVAVYGQSYGGFMVLAAITEYPDIWKAAVEFYGIANFQTFFERTGSWRQKHRAMEYGDPVKDADFLKSISPIHKADRIRVPLFVAQGLMDPRVPPYESELIVNEVRKQNLPVDYITIDDEGHGFAKLENRIRVFTAVADFLSRHL